VWFDDASARGVYAAVASDASKLVGSFEVDGPTMDEAGEIAQRDRVFAHYADGHLAMDEVSLVISSWRAQINPNSDIVTLESDGGADSIALHKSAACSQRDAALGSAGIFLVIVSSAKPMRTSSGFGSSGRH